MAKLVVIAGKLAGREYVIQKPIIIGRGEGLAIRPPDGKLSREHSKVFKQGEDYVIVDLNSRNGTLVNDAPVTRRVLHHGDEILLGSTRLRFDDPESVKPAPEHKASAPVYRQVEDLNISSEPVTPQAPAGAINADQIVIQERALQFSKKKGRKNPNVLMDDLAQSPVLHQALMILIAVVVGGVCIYLGLHLAGVIGGN
jgi:pSer/pThr/pTyr-binding forkhead associated (FHA) protein